MPGATNWEKLRKSIAKPSSTTKKKKPFKRTIFPVEEPPPPPTVPETTKRKSRPMLFRKSTEISTNITHRLALDCEMVGVGKDGKDSQHNGETAFGVVSMAMSNHNMYKNFLEESTLCIHL